MGKTISTFLYYFLISFITSFSPKRFMQALKKFVHNSVVPLIMMAPIQKWNFFFFHEHGHHDRHPKRRAGSVCFQSSARPSSRGTGASTATPTGCTDH